MAIPNQTRSSDELLFMTHARDSLAAQVNACTQALTISPEECGRIMHESWIKTMRAQGYHNPAEPCTVDAASHSRQLGCGKCHDDLIPWEQLPERKKHINRHAFDEVLAEIRRRAANFSAMQYADLLSMASEFKLSEQVMLRRSGTKWAIVVLTLSVSSAQELPHYFDSPEAAIAHFASDQYAHLLMQEADACAK